MAKVCRLCLQILQRGSKFFNINAVESFTGFMPYRDQLTTCIPEIALDLIPNPVICNSCRSALKTAYDFKNRCLTVEEKIREFVEKQPDGFGVDLIQIAGAQHGAPSEEVVNEVEITTNEVEIKHNPLEEEEEEDEGPEVVISKVMDVDKTPSATPTDFQCDTCKGHFVSSQALFFHRTTHGEGYNCNFCNESFRSLQYLRKHNSLCLKGKKPDRVQAGQILTKRPHLPTKAKNHLKRWLFRHTDHPYPTDQEKQLLMKETNLTLLQVENWFINARRRILQDLTKLKNHSKYEELLGLHAELDIELDHPTESASDYDKPSISRIKMELEDR